MATDKRDPITRYRLKRSFAVCLSVVVVGCATIASSRYLESSDKNRLESRFSGQTTNVFNGLRENFISYHEIVQSIRSFFESGTDRSRDEFDRFVARDLEQYKGIQALEWIPRVPHEKRGTVENELRDFGLAEHRLKRWVSDPKPRWVATNEQWAEEYFPVAYMQPVDGNEPALGIDLASNPARYVALCAARDSGKPFATAPITLAQESENQLGFLLFVPVYATPCSTIEERRERLLGFALGVFRVSDIVETVLAQRDLDGIHLAIRDETDHLGQGGFTLYDRERTEAISRDELSAEYEYVIGGRTWHVCFTSTESYLDDAPLSLSFWSLIAGSVFALFAGVLVHFSLSRSDEIKALVEQRTAELREAKDQLEHAQEDLHNKAELASAATRAKSEFLANMSHEIRTPMTAILGFTDLLIVDDKQNQTKESRLESLLAVKRNGLYLLDIINDILDISKIESGKLEVECIPCSVAEMLAEVSNLMSVRTESKGLGLNVRLDGSIPAQIQTDPTRLRQILINLIGNAIKFTEIGEIQVVVRAIGPHSSPTHIEFEVIDCGIGMTDEQVSKLFQPFIQADSTTTRKYGGSGLGLTISKRLVELLNGEISVQSTLGRGSVFTFSISVGESTDCEMIDTICRVENDDRYAEKRSTNQPLDCRILLAEDGPDNQRLISFLLQKMGAQVDLAENGQVACDAAMKQLRLGNAYDVILMDMQMPVLDGYRATKQLREQNYPGPIIALTAHAMSGDELKCKESGCDGYATKPIDREQLKTVIEESLHSNTETQLEESSV